MNGSLTPLIGNMYIEKHVNLRKPQFNVKYCPAIYTDTRSSYKSSLSKETFLPYFLYTASNDLLNSVYFWKPNKPIPPAKLNTNPVPCHVIAPFPLQTLWVTQGAAGSST